MADDPLRFLDMRDREIAARERIEERIFELKQQIKERYPVPVPIPARTTAASTPAPAPQSPEQDEIDELEALLRKPIVDKLYLAVRDNLAPGAKPNHQNGLLPSQRKKPLEPLTPAELQIAAVYGILVRDNETNTTLKSFGRALSVARAEYLDNKALYDKVLRILATIGDKRGGGPDDEVHESDWVAVGEALAQQGIPSDDIYLDVKTRVTLSSQTGGDDAAPPSVQEIDLPDLEAEVDLEIVESNLHAMQAIYFAAMLEEVKLFQVTDKLVEQFHQGVLPLGKGKAGDLLFKYWKRSNDRFSEVERRNLYARAFGFPGGEPSAGTPNREFNNLWLRFVSAVSSYNRQLNLDDLLRARIPASVSQEQVRKSGRDLAAALSLYGYGVAYFAATDLQSQIKDVLEILGEDEIQKAYGARDVWQVVDQVATLELGGARSAVRYRTMASSGAVIIRWLAFRRKELGAVGGTPVLDEVALRSGRVQRSNKPTVDPTDKDLIVACEQWLAVTGTPDIQVEEYAQPSEAVATTSRPVQIPQVARDLLESVPVGMGNGYLSR
jgi:hypothetical protein